MCLKCDGYSDEELDRQQDLAIRVNGYQYLNVYDPGHVEEIDGSWTYTIGLAESFGQPDFLCIGVKPERQAAIVKALGDCIVEDGFLDPAVLTDLDVSLVPVHQDHLTDGLVGAWEHRYGMAEAGDFLQVIPGASWYCRCHPANVQRMDDPAPLTQAGYRGRAA